MSKTEYTGRLYLIPVPLGDNDPSEVIPAGVMHTACSLKTFVVEELRSARRVLSRYGLRGQIESLELHELNEHSSPRDAEALLELFTRGDVGLLSEAGLPAVADPGAMLVQLCQQHGIRVVPLAGPSSLLMALMASGLNGQCFAFCGYIPAKTEQRRSALRELEKASARLGQSQIIIETPYRNDALFADMLACLGPRTRVCIAADISLPTETIRTASVEHFRAHPVSIGKRPCVFIILA